MSDNALVAAIAIALAIAVGFMANCQKNQDNVNAEIRKARIEKGLEKE